MILEREHFLRERFFALFMFECCGYRLRFLGFCSGLQEEVFGKKSIDEKSVFAMIGIGVDPEFVDRNEREVRARTTLHEVLVQFLADAASIDNPDGGVSDDAYFFEVEG